MHCSARHDDATARRDLDLGLIDPEGQRAFEHVPRFVVAIVDVQRGYERWRVGAAAGIDYFGQNQVRSRRSDGPAHQWGGVKVLGDRVKIARTHQRGPLGVALDERSSGGTTSETAGASG